MAELWPGSGDREEHLPPLTPKFRATARMAAAHDCDWDEATWLVEHTLEGHQVLLNELLRELGRALAKATKDDASAIRRFAPPI